MVASVDDGFPRGYQWKHNKLFHDNVHRNVYIDSVSPRLSGARLLMVDPAC